VIERHAVARVLKFHLVDRAQRAVRIERYDAVGEENRLIHVVGDQHHGGVGLGADFGQLVLELGTGERIERGQRLIQQQHFGLHGERTRHGHALPHAAR